MRIGKTVDADGAGPLSPTTERYVYGPNGMVLWALTDHLGSVRDVVDGAGTIQNHLVYDSFGKVVSQTQPTVLFGFGYTGRELDVESGLQYNRARYYDSSIGRFISEDAIGFGGDDTNLYRYILNSSANFIDPLGERTARPPVNMSGKIKKAKGKMKVISL